MSMPLRFICAAVLFGIVSTAGCGLEKSSIYFPDRGITTLPSDVGLAYENLYLTTEDGVRINAWYVPRPGSDTMILWFHGNAGNLSSRVESVLLFHRNLEANILILDYRQYGKSEGRISEAGTYLDATAAFDYLAERAGVDQGRLIVFGQSLGSAVAVELATRRRVSGLILEAPFTSIRDMARSSVPWLPLGPLLSIRYDSLSKIGRIGAPLLVLHGNRDRVVPYDQGRRIYDAAPDPKVFYTIPGAGHNDTLAVGGRAYFDAIRTFITDLPDAEGNPD
jgi:uncharacterized protein